MALINGKYFYSFKKSLSHVTQIRKKKDRLLLAMVSPQPLHQPQSKLSYEIFWDQSDGLSLAYKTRERIWIHTLLWIKHLVINYFHSHQ